MISSRQPAGIHHIGRIICLTLALLSPLLIQTGCARSEEAAEEYQADMIVSFTMDKSVYRPEESVFFDVTLTNNTTRQLNIRALDPASTRIAFNRMADGETPVFRDAVTSLREDLTRMITLEPGQSIKRRFQCTRLTHFTGPMVAQVHYDPNPINVEVNGPPVYSNIVAYEVTGEPLFERDAAGLLLDKDAIALATARSGGKVEEAKSIFIEDEKSGLYLIWVNLSLSVAGPDGQPQRAVKSWLVDPYRGVVMKESRPFNPEMAVDARLRERPQNLPPRTIQGGAPAAGGAAK